MGDEYEQYWEDLHRQDRMLIALEDEGGGTGVARRAEGWEFSDVGRARWMQSGAGNWWEGSGSEGPAVKGLLLT